MALVTDNTVFIQCGDSLLGVPHYLYTQRKHYTELMKPLGLEVKLR